MTNRDGEAAVDTIRYDNQDIDRERMELIETHLGAGVRTVADIGCGGGRNALYFAARGYAAVGLDRDPALLATLRERAAGLGLADRVRTRRVDLDAAVRAPGRGRAEWDAALLLDVLEHVADDAATLAWTAARTRGRIFVNVPRETPDVLRTAGYLFPPYADPTHRRYYTEDRLAAVAARAGLRVVDLRLINPVHPEGFIHLMLDRSHLPTRLLGFFLHGRGRSVRFKRECMSVFAVLEAGK